MDKRSFIVDFQCTQPCICRDTSCFRNVDCLTCKLCRKLNVIDFSQNNSQIDCCKVTEDIRLILAPDINGAGICEETRFDIKAIVVEKNLPISMNVKMIQDFCRFRNESESHILFYACFELHFVDV